MKITELNWMNIITSSIGLISYLIFNIFGIIILCNYQYMNQIWYYNLLSLLIVPLFFIMTMCRFNYLNYYFFIFIFILVIWGGILIFNKLAMDNLWLFSLVTFCCQILILNSPCLLKLYLFVCSLKTPCCCLLDYNNSDLEDEINSKENFQEQKVNNEV